MIREKRQINSLYREPMYEIPMTFDSEDERKHFFNVNHNSTEKVQYGISDGRFQVYKSNYPFIL
jgi:hypothetical protein